MARKYILLTSLLQVQVLLVVALVHYKIVHKIIEMHIMITSTLDKKHIIFESSLRYQAHNSWRRREVVWQRLVGALQRLKEGRFNGFLLLDGSAACSTPRRIICLQWVGGEFWQLVVGGGRLSCVSQQRRDLRIQQWNQQSTTNSAEGRNGTPGTYQPTRGCRALIWRTQSLWTLVACHCVSIRLRKYQTCAQPDIPWSRMLAMVPYCFVGRNCLFGWPWLWKYWWWWKKGGQTAYYKGDIYPTAHKADNGSANSQCRAHGQWHKRVPLLTANKEDKQAAKNGIAYPTSFRTWNLWAK
jgi:hypothetical protein